MDVTIPAVLKSLASTGEAIRELSAWKRRARGNVRSLIEELRDNMIYLDMVAVDNVDLKEVIAKISVSEYRRLSREGFDFNALKRARLAAHPSLAGTELASWAGKETAELVEAIYEKLNELAIRFPHVGTHEKYRWNVRVNNIRKRIWLLLEHLRD